jgi:LmbE family N-acetylglucosaminyl deacetylase
MEFTNPSADVFVPDGCAVDQALARTTHLAVGAHQDDIEFMALHGILECFNRKDRWFTGVTVTNGAGSARSGPYAQYSDGEMQRVRMAEQRKAALVGEYGCQIQLMFPSSAVKDASNRGPVEDLQRIFEAARPKVVYLHNPADKHDTHVACCLRALTALRNLHAEWRPTKVYGCEGWRDLDWLLDEDKQILPVDAHDNLAAALSGIFDSQIRGGKRYDLAVQGRRSAHATFHQSHAVDEHNRLIFAMDLTPLVEDPSADVCTFTLALLDRTKQDIKTRLAVTGYELQKNEFQ